MDKFRFARSLRKNQTAAETRLWGCLRKRSFQDCRFNRQVTLGPYTVDFLCREKRLVIEVDGATHGEGAEVEHDRRRTEFLVKLGFQVFRVDNADVFKNLDAVLDGLLMVLAKRKSVFASRKHPLPLRDLPQQS